MGLDSVELLYSFEKYFSIEIPDVEAQNIRSVKDMVNSVSSHKSIASEKSNVKSNILSQFQEILNLKEDVIIFEIHDASDKTFWKSLENETGLKIPIPNSAKYMGNNIGNKIKNMFSISLNYEWREITLDRLCDVICFANYEKLLVADQIANKFDVYIAIGGITQDRIGIEFYEIFPEKIFVSDFGID